MAIKFNRNMAVAKKVLNAINKQIPNEMAKNCTVEAYSNGREQGYCIWYHPSLPFLKVSFSENRNSDEIVVYKGKDIEFSLQGNLPSEEIYQNRKYFRYNEINATAKYIIDFFKQPNFNNPLPSSFNKKLKTVKKILKISNVIDGNSHSKVSVERLQQLKKELISLE